MDIIKRNTPILVIGGFTLLVFLGIIIAGAKAKPVNQPVLEPTNEQQLITSHTFMLGSSDAPITIVEFSDYECPACQIFHPIIQNIYNENSGLVRVAFRHFPLPQHPFARKASEAAQLAGENGKFWEYSTLLFENNTNLMEDDLVKYAEQVGLDGAKFRTDLSNPKYRDEVSQDIADADKLGLNSTPSFYLNGKMMQVTNPQDFQNKVLDEINKVRGVKTENNIQPTEARVDQKKDPLEITYSAEGFDPITTDGYMGQKVVISNTSDKPVTISQAEQKSQEFGSSRVIEAGGIFEFTLDQKNRWILKDKGSNFYVSIFVY